MKIPFRRNLAVSTYFEVFVSPHRRISPHHQITASVGSEAARTSGAAVVAPRPRVIRMGVLWERVETRSAGSSQAGKDTVGGAIACVVGKRQVQPGTRTSVTVLSMWLLL